MKRHPLLAFFALSFVFSWAVWVPMVLASHGRMTPWMPQDLAHRWGAFGPFFAALIVTYGHDGAPGLRKLLGRFFIWRVGVSWYLVALFLPALISLLVTLMHVGLGGQMPDFMDPPIHRLPRPGFYGENHVLVIMVPYYLQSLLLGTSIGEELGWRGFALPHIQSRCNALLSSVLLGLLWAWWMLPMALLEGGIPFYYILLGVVPASIISTWLFNNAKGSLLLVVLYNNSFKTTDWFLSAPVTNAYFVVIAFWIVAAAVVAWAGPGRLSRRPLDPQCRERRQEAVLPFNEIFPIPSNQG